MAGSRRPFNRKLTIIERKIQLDVRDYEYDLQAGIGGINLSGLNSNLHSTKSRLRSFVKSTPATIKEKIEEKLLNMDGKGKCIQEAYSDSDELFIRDQSQLKELQQELRETIKKDQDIMRTLKAQTTLKKNNIKQMRKRIKTIKGVVSENTKCVQ